MSKINLIDQAFYKLETSGFSPLLMGGAMILDPTDSPYPMDGKMLVDHLAARLEKIPLMRKKMVQDSLKIGSMRLVDDPGFNVKNHITLSTLPSPGGYKELTEWLGEFSSERLDLAKPLWHYEVIEGLEGGRIGLATHIHHSFLDGIGAMKTLGSMFDVQAVPPEQPGAEGWQSEAEPGKLGLLRDAVTEAAGRMVVKAPVFFAKNALPAFNGLIKVLDSANKKPVPSKTSVSKVNVPKVHKTSINVKKLSEKRAVAYVEFPFKEIKALSKTFNCSINDITLLLNSVALEHYFDKIGELVDFDLVAAMPINLRTADDASSGNVLTIGRLSLRNQVSDIDERLQAIVRDTQKIKHSSKPQSKGDKKPAFDSKGLIDLFSPIVLDALIYGVLSSDLHSKINFANVAITNVPGSQIPMYIGGAKQVSIVPMAPTADTVGLTITISSTDKNLVMGYHGCGEAIKNKELFVAGAKTGFAALKKSAKQLSKTNSRTNDIKIG